MSGNVSGLHVFAGDVGPEALSLLDTNYNALTVAFNNLNAFTNYYVDSGIADAAVVTITGNQTMGLTPGVTVTILMAATNLTAAPTLNVNGTGAIVCRDSYGGNIYPGQLVIGTLRTFTYNGSAWICQNISNFSPYDPITIVKSKAATTTRNSTVFTTADPDLTIALPANGIWSIELTVMAWATTTAAMGMNASLSYSGSFVAASSLLANTLQSSGPTWGVAAGQPTQIQAAAGTIMGILQVSANLGTSQATLASVTSFGMIQNTTIGSLTFNWAQFSSSANNLNLSAGSLLKVTRVG